MRLSELAAPSSEESRLLQALSGMEAHRPSAFAKRRIRARLAASSSAPRQLRRVALAVVLLGGTASALVGGQLLTGEEEAPKAALSPAEAKASKAPLSPVHAARPQAPSIEQQAEPVVVAESRGVQQGKAARRTAPAIHRMPEGEDPTKVVEALSALRKEGDPARAQALLKRYMADNPKGALSEEALALSIEAAHAKGDPRARTYAKRYLTRFPSGRHRVLARQVLAK
jgi:hypothetical protein